MSYSFRGIAVSDDLIESLKAYVETGRPTGDFLRACIDNNLSEACGRADEESAKALPAIVGYLYNECPARCWGFAGAHDSWVTIQRAWHSANAEHPAVAE